MAPAIIVCRLSGFFADLEARKTETFLIVFDVGVRFSV